MAVSSTNVMVGNNVSNFRGNITDLDIQEIKI
jgi:hypothetical protein